MTELTLSPLPHTWIFDVDGTICVHNGYKNGGDVLLDGVKDLFAKIPADDMIILLTSRKEQERENINVLLTYAYNTNGTNYKVIPFTKLSTELANYKSYYEKYSSLLTSSNDKIKVYPIGE